MIVKVKMTRKEKKFAEAYAKTQDTPLGKYENNPKTYSLEEIKKEIGL